MVSTLEEYNNLYESYIKNPNVEPPYEKLYNTCISILLDENTCVEKKEEVLSKLIFICPDDAELYYYMGCILKDNPIKSSLWFRLCMQHSKTPNIENILDLIKNLFDNSYNEYIKYIIELYPHYIELPYIEDIRIQNSVISNSIKMKKIENMENILKKYNIFSIIQNPPLSSETFIFFTPMGRWNEHDSSELPLVNLKTHNYNPFISNNAYCNLINNISIYYYLFGNIKKALQYSNPYVISCEFIKPKKNMFCKFLLLWNYFYSHKALYIDNYNPIEEDIIEHNNLYQNHCAYNNSLYDHSHSFVFSKYEYCSNKIKIGYISNGFVNNVISNFIQPILINHNKELFEIHLFSFIESQCSHLNTIYQLHSHVLSEDPIKNATLIHNLHIAILIDLDTFTGCGLDILSKNPAPIQMTYIGYPNSTGLDFIHYRITDHNADHPESSQCNNEKLLKLPGCFLLYDSILQTEFIDNYDYNKNSITLCAINNEIKHSTNVLCAWKSILKINPHCKLLIKINSRDCVELQLEYYSEQLNVDKNRLIIVPYSDNNSYVKIFQTTDIVLDTFPYSGTTTTCNALYNSSPVVTMYNKHLHCHNVSSSILMHCGLNELVTFSIEEYVNKVTYLCNNIEVIRRYKRTLHQKFVTAMDPSRFMVGYENALFEVYRNL
jgi:hypothetical protein